VARRTDVLVVGAGPTGLNLAIWLVRLGVRVRVIDRAPEPGATSRALVVHARTLELYGQLGIADEVIARSVRFSAVNLWVAGRHVGRAAFGDLGAGISPHPYLLIFAQDDHERLLIKVLSSLGVEVERPAELARLEESAQGVTATIRRPGAADEVCEASYIAGCDGASSKVREELQAGFPGGTYEHRFYVADVVARGPVMNGELHVALDDADFLAIFPMKGDDRVRLVGSVRDDVTRKRESITWDDVGQLVVERMQIGVSRINWFSVYHVHHRVASHFRRGRAFLLGDAAHIHSPVGGQGMNTGIGDAAGLGWRLAAALRDPTAAPVLDSYEPERIAFARRLVQTTDRAFTVVTRNGRIARFVRLHVVPTVIPRLFDGRGFRRYMFRVISQTSIEYRASPLSEGSAGQVRAGDRLPWIPFASGSDAMDNYGPLASLVWQVHVYGTPTAELRALCEARRLMLCGFAWSGAAETKGFARDAIYLVRPDGYVGFAGSAADLARFAGYLDRWRVA
jgi:2-polyprenyl-6-methoxyphenol hydroxylase-like FAD-dependent oxidoreductase